jgi:hypothetical protein
MTFGIRINKSVLRALGDIARSSTRAVSPAPTRAREGSEEAQLALSHPRYARVTLRDDRDQALTTPYIAALPSVKGDGR